MRFNFDIHPRDITKEFLHPDTGETLRIGDIVSFHEPEMWGDATDWRGVIIDIEDDIVTALKITGENSCSLVIRARPCDGTFRQSRQ